MRNALQPFRRMFAAGHAIFSGRVFLSVMGIILAPVVHRILHKFHLDEQDLSGSGS
jgi:hypothetical protein